jgi:hypothetical protein
MDSDDEARAWIAGWAQRWTDETDASWAVADRRDDRPLGQVGRVEGTMRRSMLHADGWHDMHLHARLRADGDRTPPPFAPGSVGAGGAGTQLAYDVDEEVEVGGGGTPVADRRA